MYQWDKSSCIAAISFTNNPDLDTVGRIKVRDTKGGTYRWCSVQDYVLEQFTGLKDSKGADIYEGDILRIYRDSGMGYDDTEVMFISGRFVGQNKGDKQYGLFFSLDTWTTEVIGNIHEKPELIESIL